MSRTYMAPPIRAELDVKLDPLKKRVRTRVRRTKGGEEGEGEGDGEREIAGRKGGDEKDEQRGSNVGIRTRRTNW